MGTSSRAKAKTEVVVSHPQPCENCRSLSLRLQSAAAQQHYLRACLAEEQQRGDALYTSFPRQSCASAEAAPKQQPQVRPQELAAGQNPLIPPDPAVVPTVAPLRHKVADVLNNLFKWALAPVHSRLRRAVAAIVEAS